MSASVAAIFAANGKTLDNTLGAVFLGVVGASFLFGVTFLQAYLYYHHYPQDSLLHKIAVGVLWACDALHLCFTVHAVYFYVVSGFGDLERLPNIVWSFKAQVTLNVIIILIVHSLYAFRVWLLSGYHGGVLGYIVASVVAAGFVIGIVFSYLLYQVNTFDELDHIAWSIDASLATSTTIDFIIAATMCYYLRKSKGGVSHLNSSISTVMQYSLSSGLFTSACSLLTLFTYTLMPHNMVFLGLQFLSTKLYVGSFLTMMNARKRRRSSSSATSRSEVSSFGHGMPTFSLSLGRQSSRRTSSTLEPGSALSTSSDKKPWDVELEAAPAIAEPSPPAPLLVYPFHGAGRSPKPEYMQQW